MVVGGSEDVVGAGGMGGEAGEDVDEDVEARARQTAVYASYNMLAKPTMPSCTMAMCESE
jgi:hypothetical protein